MSGKQVCVTGAGGFIGSHVTRRLLEKGYRVRATVRDHENEQKTAHLRALVPDAQDSLEIVSADLMKPGSFDAAMQGCELACHVASAVYLTAKDPQKEIVDPAVNGTKNVLESVVKAGTVKKVVLTSSIAAVQDNQKPDDHTFTEADWNESAELKTDPYPLSKALAEKAAWEFQKALPGDKRFDLIAINPVLVLGPVYTRVHARSSPDVIRALLKRQFPACPRLQFGVVDVRDVAEAHVRALERDGANGRYILHHKALWMRELAEIIAKRYPPPEFKVPTKNLPNLMMYLAAIFDKRLSWAFLRTNLNRTRRFRNSKVQENLGIEFTPIEESVLDTCASMIELGIVKPKGK